MLTLPLEALGQVVQPGPGEAVILLGRYLLLPVNHLRSASSSSRGCGAQRGSAAQARRSGRLFNHGGAGAAPEPPAASAARVKRAARRHSRLRRTHDTADLGKATNLERGVTG